MKRRLRPDELRLWAVVASTVRPASGPSAPAPPMAPEPPPPSAVALAPPAKAPAKGPPPYRPPTSQAGARLESPHAIEPRRARRIARERDEIAGRLDLHGYDQDAARSVLLNFLRRAQAEGWRAVLVITGKGTRSDGVLRRRTPEWLADPSLRSVVAGVSEAHRRHGGEGALYVALKRPAQI